MSEQLTFVPLGEFEAICRYWQANHPQYLAHLRELAVQIARRLGEVTIDDVREEMEKFQVPFPSEIGADDRLFGAVLRCDKRLKAVASRTTRRADWAKRVGVNRDQVTVYKIKAVA